MKNNLLSLYDRGPNRVPNILLGQLFVIRQVLAHI